MTCAPKPPPCIERERQRPLLDRDRAGGRGLGAGRGTRAVRRRRHSRAQPRCEISRHARGGLPRLPVVAHRHPRAAEPGVDRCRQLEERLRGRQAHRLARAPGARAQPWPAIAAAATNPSGTRSTARSCSRMRSATICASPPASGRTSSRSVPTCCCICMSRGRRRWCPWISPARVCIGAAIAAKAAARRSRRTSRRPCCCARVGRGIATRAARCSIRCAVPALFSPKAP